MNSNELTYLLENPGKITPAQLGGLKELIEAYPYFQPARALYLKGLKEENSILYNKELKTTAAYTTDRSVLFHYITSNNYNEDENPTHPAVKNLPKKDGIPLEEETIDEEIKKAESILNPYLFERKIYSESQQTPEEYLEIDKPLDFQKDDTHSFIEWLKLTSAKPIIREEEKTAPPKETPQVSIIQKNETRHKKARREQKFKLIDKFIEDSPKINPKNPTSSDNLAKSYTHGSEALMTETLAKVYVQQKNYKKAIQAYKILILKNPEKSGFFADQIRAINKLQENNT